MVYSSIDECFTVPDCLTVLLGYIILAALDFRLIKV